MKSFQAYSIIFFGHQTIKVGTISYKLTLNSKTLVIVYKYINRLVTKRDATNELNDFRRLKYITYFSLKMSPEKFYIINHL